MPETRPATAIARLSAEPADLIADVCGMASPGIRLDDALLDAAMRGWSINTRRVFRSDLALWDEWCCRHGVPARVADAAAGAAWMRVLAGIDAAHGKVRAMATIERYLVHVG